MLGVPGKILFPSHGPPTFEIASLLEHTLEHRTWRLEKIIEAVSSDAETVESIAECVYKGIDPKLRDLCIRTTRAALEYLEEDGRVASSENDLYARK
jgi:hypothetical protein